MINRLPRIILQDNLEMYWKIPELYYYADSFILASHGEGWGLPLTEAMSLEIPTIATNFSGNTHYMNDMNSFLIPVDHFVASNVIHNDWAGIHLHDIQFILRYVYDHPDIARQKAVLVCDFYFCIRIYVDINILIMICVIYRSGKRSGFKICELECCDRSGKSIEKY